MARLLHLAAPGTLGARPGVPPARVIEWREPQRELLGGRRGELK
ncbi:MAG: hypothetical protein Q8P41_13145 [Pseudomonadota bacterium]|nr:hypothetical protein [Pseudomonadota bacterium]